MNRLMQPAARAVRTAISRPAARQMSGDVEEATKLMSTWKMVSAGGAVAVVCIGGYVFSAGHEEHFDLEKNKFHYMQVRNKAFPWSCSDCSLFDTKCWAEARAAKQ
mmetsp:Transcript_22233/g.55721  ORF Transcript_22233/g.55721 Transcript_22233/m.55721 type:complete len:106 (+) Transcript_22233:34-351(+)|eukprot:CAMPEP_0173431880 /NCGR_PEP_ID=MMETSP1357-20121228/9873_1 /TAXON_ID=77926 /ORGANISM="Hemiselmis rufescens, Strain PCC563" /LENGTH=105 /DNA_ID=CAMNT_0014396407 /DNA_START=38 /DNA_END=355 /DNA_ORIENTATION=+